MSINKVDLCWSCTENNFAFVNYVFSVVPECFPRPWILLHMTYLQPFICSNGNSYQCSQESMTLLQMAVVYNDHSLYLWDISSTDEIEKAYSSLYHNACVWDVCVSVCVCVCVFFCWISNGWTTRYMYDKKCSVVFWLTAMHRILCSGTEVIPVLVEDIHVFVWLSATWFLCFSVLSLTALSNFLWWVRPWAHPSLVLCHLFLRQHGAFLADVQSRSAQLSPGCLSGWKIIAMALFLS